MFLAAALLLTAVLAGCSSDKGDDAADGLDSSAAPVLYLNVTAGNQTYRYTSAVAASGTTSGAATVSASASATGSSTGSWWR